MDDPVCSCHVQDQVLVAGFGRRGHAVGDIPGVRFKVRLGPDTHCSVAKQHGLACCQCQQREISSRSELLGGGAGKHARLHQRRV